MSAQPSSTDFLDNLELNCSPAPTAWAKHEVQTWRGSCIGLLARAETVLSNALVSLRPDGASLGGVHFVGKRLSKVQKLFTERGDGKAVAALVNYRDWLDLRHFLCHGELLVQSVADGTWFAIFTMVRVDRDKPCRAMRIVTSSDAVEHLQKLQHDTNHLVTLVRRYATTSIPLENAQIRAAAQPTSN